MRQQKTNKFISAYRAKVSCETEPPGIYSPHTSASAFDALSQKRTKKYASSARANPRADYIGLMGELAFQCYMEVTPEIAWESFQSGLQGDGGIDCIYWDMEIDIKASASRFGPNRYYFTVMNRNWDESNVVAFVWLKELPNGATMAYLLGWTYKQHINTLIRPSESYDFLAYVRIQDLKQRGQLYPIAHLLLHKPIRQKGGKYA